jgi:hypothetical protein
VDTGGLALGVKETAPRLLWHINAVCGVCTASEHLALLSVRLVGTPHRVRKPVCGSWAGLNSLGFH